MTKNSFEIIKVFMDLTEAKLAQTKLDAHGIESWLDNENLTSLNWLYMNLTGGIRLRVDKKHAKEARLIIENVETKDINDPELIKESVTKKRIIVWISIITFILIMLFGIVI